jgi:hypothetical protein
MLTNVDCAIEPGGQVTFGYSSPPSPYPELTRGLALLMTYDGKEEAACYLDIAGAKALREAIDAYLADMGESAP